MNSLWQLIFSISIAFALTACAPDYDDPHPIPVQQQQPSETKEYTINGMKVDEFYAQLYLKVAGNCCPNTVTYQYPKSDIVQIGYYPNGNPVLANLSLILVEDHSYRAIYREWVKLPFGGSYAVVEQKIVSGSWKTEETNLMLDGLGKAEGLSFNGKPALRIRFAKDIIHAGIQNRTLLLDTSVNSWAPFPEYNPCDL
ncbi:MAG: hypothetical protein AB7H97_11850 [Pseudobdellovibrionaceae bacterium]